MKNLELTRETLSFLHMPPNQSCRQAKGKPLPENSRGGCKADSF